MKNIQISIFLCFLPFISFAQIKVGDKIPHFSVMTLDDKVYDSDKILYNNKVIVLNFWFPSCAPCLAEIPELNEVVVYFAKKRKEIIFLAPSVEGVKEYLKKFVEKKKFTYKVIKDGLPIANLFGITSYPTNIVINKKGEITFFETGYKSNIKETLIKEIEKNLKE